MKKPYLQCVGEVWQKARMRALVRDDFKCQAGYLKLIFPSYIETAC